MENGECLKEEGEEEDDDGKYLVNNPIPGKSSIVDDDMYLPVATKFCCFLDQGVNVTGIGDVAGDDESAVG